MNKSEKSVSWREVHNSCLSLPWCSVASGLVDSHLLLVLFHGRVLLLNGWLWLLLVLLQLLGGSVRSVHLRGERGEGRRGEGKGERGVRERKHVDYGL